MNKQKLVINACINLKYIFKINFEIKNNEKWAPKLYINDYINNILLAF